MNDENQAAKPSELNAGLGAAVIVRGQVVAWFADFTEEAREWCTENHFGEWLTWQAKPPEIVPLTEAEYDEAVRNGKELAALLFKDAPEAPNAELTCGVEPYLKPATLDPSR